MIDMELKLTKEVQPWSILPLIVNVKRDGGVVVKQLPLWEPHHFLGAPPPACTTKL